MPRPVTRQRSLAGLLVFTTALLLRLAFWQATPDAAWPGSARYVGDAALWVEAAEALATGHPRSFELGLPLRPPANGWLLSWLGVEGGDLGTAQFAWCVLGALACWLAFKAAEPAFGTGIATAVGLVCAGSTALMTLSTSLNNETPYLVVVMATLALGERLRQRVGREGRVAGEAVRRKIGKGKEAKAGSGAESGSAGKEAGGLAGARRSSGTGAAGVGPGREPAGARWWSLRSRPSRVQVHDALSFAAWGLLGAVGCLFRAEHALLVVLLGAWLGWAVMRPVARRGGGTALARPLGYGLLGLLLPLILWHASAWAAIEHFNQEPPLRIDGERYRIHRLQGRMQAALDHPRWSAEAEAERRRWPALIRRTATLFVELTARHRALQRGEAPPRQIGAAEVAALEEAFGALPRPLPAHPFVALYGGLNFHLANHAGADGRFSRGPLEAQPPLAGGPGAYPPQMIAGLPPDELVLTYPGHLAEVNHGWERGLRWMRRNPGDAARLVAEKLRRFWAGASMGLGGYDLPLGTAGVRWPVDLAVPEGLGDRLRDSPAAKTGASGGAGDAEAEQINEGRAGEGRSVGAVQRLWVSTWRLVVLLAALAGALLGRPRAVLAPWLLLFAAKAATAAAFFGYARLGATIVPVVALLVSLAAARLLAAPLARFAPTPRRRRALVATAALLLVVMEGIRWRSSPSLRLDGHAITRTGPYPADDPVQRHLDKAVDHRQCSARPKLLVRLR